MTTVTLSDAQLRTAAEAGAETFLKTITQAIRQACSDQLDENALTALTAPQLTLWAFDILREEVEEGGFIQLIHNGWGPFFFQNPFARLMKDWGLKDFSKMIYSARDLYREHGEALTADCTDEEFMALYEQYPDFEPLDDDFIDREDEFVEAVAHYVDEHLEDFIVIKEA